MCMQVRVQESKHGEFGDRLPGVNPAGEPIPIPWADRQLDSAEHPGDTFK